MQVKKNQTVLLRLDFNVPVSEKGKIIETFRIDESLPAILQLQKREARVVVIAHKESGSLEVVAKYLKNKVENFSFINEVATINVQNKINNLKDGEVLLVENLRLDNKEKKNDVSLANFFAALCDVYINDAFSASHRNHSSIVALPQAMKKMKKTVHLGPLFQKELAQLEKAVKPKHPLLLLIGGAKFETKLNLLSKYENVADSIFVGGALAHSFFSEWGYELGTSLKDNEVKLPKKILESEKIVLPVDVIVRSDKAKSKITESDKILSDEKVVDFGPNTLSIITELSKNAKTIIWNGPMGWYEKGFDKGTKELLITLGQMKGKTVILGGGDTVAVAKKLLTNKKYSDLKFTHISTGGGAMIDYLANGTLPGIKAILI